MKKKYPRSDKADYGEDLHAKEMKRQKQKSVRCGHS